MVGGGATASWWPGCWIVVAGNLGERDKLVVVVASGLDWCSIRLTWWSAMLRNHWILWLVVVVVVVGGDRCLKVLI
jgi:hypothetical protein